MDQRNAALDVDDEDLLVKLGSVEAQIEALEASMATYTDRQKAKAGTIVTITHEGVLEVHRGLIKPTSQRPAARR
ncbi:hypothetical protein [Cupriavidus sp. WS]|uniref:hypothetical protein n=1 Tax=Cupriavidus sp. WS TaxID=1312922 RepID=UPI000361F879|nr:hypothetical protein [Cupriavidus sp. WS]